MNTTTIAEKPGYLTNVRCCGGHTLLVSKSGWLQSCVLLVTQKLLEPGEQLREFSAWKEEKEKKPYHYNQSHNKKNSQTKMFPVLLPAKTPIVCINIPHTRVITIENEHRNWRLRERTPPGRRWLHYKAPLQIITRFSAAKQARCRAWWAVQYQTILKSKALENTHQETKQAKNQDPYPRKGVTMWISSERDTTSWLKRVMQRRKLS